MNLDQNAVSLQPAKFHTIPTLSPRWPLMALPFDLALCLSTPLLLQEGMFCLFYIKKHLLGMHVFVKVPRRKKKQRI